MQKEFIISIELDDEQNEMLENIRWKHIDIDSLVEQELEDKICKIIREYGEVR